MPRPRSSTILLIAMVNVINFLQLGALAAGDKSVHPAVEAFFRSEDPLIKETGKQRLH